MKSDDKKRIIKKANEIKSDFEKNNKDTIVGIIENYLPKPKIITSKNDVKGANGFYIILSSRKPKASKCTCKVDVKSKTFYAVYRGHSSDMKKRIVSHLFYDSTCEYPNCMKIMRNSQRYNINIETKSLYNKGVIDANALFPEDEWAIVTVPLSRSKQFLREIFEEVFDDKFEKPPYSDK